MLIFNIFFLIWSLFIYSKAEISDLRHCADPNCESLISIGRTTQRYNRKEEGVLSFKADEVVSIYSKEAGTNKNLWGAKINGVSGYVPHKFIKEDKVIIRTSMLKHFVPTENNSSQKPENPKSGNIGQGNLAPSSSDKGEINSSSEDVNIHSNKENILLDEIPLNIEDSEFAALKAFSSKGDEGILDAFPKVENENKKVESIDNEERPQVPINSIEVSTENKVLEVPIDNPEVSSVSIKNNEESQVPVNIEEFQVPTINKDELKVHADNVQASQVLNNNNEGSEVPIYKEGFQDELNALTDNVETSQVPIDNNEGSLVPAYKEELQVPINKDGSPILTDNVEGSKVPIDDKKGLQIPINNNEGSQVLKTREPSEKKKEIKIEELVPLEGKEKPHLKRTNKEKKGEEEMGNNEGNGNEGEDNGSEYIGDWSPENKIEAPVDSSSAQPGADNIPDTHLVKEEIEKEFDGEGPPSAESSTFVPPVPATNVKKPFEETAKLVVSDKSLPDNEVLQPTPSKIEVVEGTTIILDEPDSYEPLDISELNVTHSNLESSNKRINPNIENTTPTPHLPDATPPITKPPLLMPNLKIPTESILQIKSEIDTPPVGEVSKGLLQESTMSESSLEKENTVSTDINKDTLNIEQQSEKDENDLTLEFSTPKPQTVLEQSVNDEIDIQIESQIKSTDDVQLDVLENVNEISNEKHILTKEGDEVVSLKTESASSEILSPDYSENIHSNIENYEDQQNQIADEESLNSVQDEVLLPSKSEENDADQDDEIESGGFFSSISNIFGYHKSESGSESKQEESSDTQQEYSKDSNSEANSDSEEFIETSSDNINDTSDSTINSIPFIDPFSAHKQDHKELPHNQNSVDEKPSSVPESDNSEELDFSSSIKKKLLHVSEAVLSEGMSLAIEGELADPHLSKGTVIFLLVVSGTIVLLYISHMIIVKMSRESPILESLNKLDRNQRVLVEENKTLKRRLTDSNGQIKSAMVTDPVALKNLKQQFEETKKKLIEDAEELRERNQQLEVDLEASTANEVELHRMLDELLANQTETSNFEDSVNSLQLMLENQKEVVDNLTSDLALKTRLNEELRIELKDSKSKLSKLEYQIEQLTSSLEDVNRLKQELTKKLTSEEESSLFLREMNNTLRQETDKVSKESETRYQETQKLLKDIRKLKQVLHSKETECQISKECVKKLQIFSDSGGNDVMSKLAEVFKIIEVKTQLESIQFERASIKAQLEEKKIIVSSQGEELKRIESENVCLKSSSERLQKERNEAVSKLEILSQYYDEKEAQLKKALESQEDLLHTAEGSANLVSNRIHTYELELASCRSQIESLKNELEEQKQSYKIQLSNEEKKFHETWLSARAAERRQEELRQENTQLRQSLTHIQRDSGSKMFNKPLPKRVDANGSISSPIPVENDIGIPHPPLDIDGTMPPMPPPPMMFPPPPGLPPLPPRMFGPPLPPPPHHHHHHHPHPLPDRRLPPAGRIASPPGYDRRSYSPESDRSRYSDHRYSPPAFSPNNQRGLSPDRRSDHMRRNIRRDTRRSPSLERHSPPRERWSNYSPTGGPPRNHRTPPPMDYYDSPSTQDKRRGNPIKGKKTSTPIGPNDR